MLRGKEGSKRQCQEQERLKYGGQISSNTATRPPARCQCQENCLCAASQQSCASSLLPPQHVLSLGDAGTPLVHLQPRGHADGCGRAAADRARLVGLGPINISVQFPHTQPCLWFIRPEPHVRQPGRALFSPKTTAAAYAKHITGAKTSRSRVFYS